mmetsp:Transcript_20378/g.29470  ORF Transcript_20378/g.29470 Transcript_20378/m.29470 type:complete len:240 (-) Transcript_20378:446-1165(-)
MKILLLSLVLLVAFAAVESNLTPEQEAAAKQQRLMQEQIQAEIQNQVQKAAVAAATAKAQISQAIALQQQQAALLAAQQQQQQQATAATVSSNLVIPQQQVLPQLPPAQSYTTVQTTTTKDALQCDERLSFEYEIEIEIGTNKTNPCSADQEEDIAKTIVQGLENVLGNNITLCKNPIKHRLGSDEYWEMIFVGFRSVETQDLVLEMINDKDEDIQVWMRYNFDNLVFSGEWKKIVVSQ